MRADNHNGHTSAIFMHFALCAISKQHPCCCRWC